MIRVVIGSAVALASPGLAGPLLWQNVEAGMKAEDAMRLYPESKTKPKVRYSKSSILLIDVPVGACLADVTISTNQVLADPSAIVDSVELIGYGCAGATFRSLVGKYGPPVEGKKRDQVVGLSAGNDERRDAIWSQEGKMISFTSERGGVVSNWKLKYEPVRDLGL